MSSFFLIKCSKEKVNRALYKYFDIEVKQFTNNIITGVVVKNVKEINGDLFEITVNKDNEITMLDYNTKKVNDILRKINIMIEKKIKHLEEGKVDDFVNSSFSGKKFYITNGIVCEVPMGLIWGNSFFANFGPTIPIRLAYLGYVNTYLITDVKDYGINNVFLSISLEVQVTGHITMPLTSKESIMKLKIPLAIKLIQGKVPEYYGGFSKSSAVYSTGIK